MDMSNLFNIHPWDINILFSFAMCLLYFLPVSESFLVLLFRLKTQLNNLQQYNHRQTSIFAAILQDYNYLEFFISDHVWFTGQ